MSILIRFVKLHFNHISLQFDLDFLYETCLIFLLNHFFYFDAINILTDWNVFFFFFVVHVIIRFESNDRSCVCARACLIGFGTGVLIGGLSGSMNEPNLTAFAGKYFGFIVSIFVVLMWKFCLANCRYEISYVRGVSHSALFIPHSSTKPSF